MRWLMQTLQWRRGRSPGETSGTNFVYTVSAWQWRSVVRVGGPQRRRSVKPSFRRLIRLFLRVLRIGENEEMFGCVDLERGETSWLLGAGEKKTGFFEGFRLIPSPDGVFSRTRSAEVEGFFKSMHCRITCRNVRLLTPTRLTLAQVSEIFLMDTNYSALAWATPTIVLGLYLTSLFLRRRVSPRNFDCEGRIHRRPNPPILKI